MKNGIIALVVSLIVLASAAFWFSRSENPVPAGDLVQFGIIIVLVGFGVYFAWRRFSSAKKGEPLDDELSKKMIQKTAAWSYYISLYMWVFMIWLKDRVDLDTDELLGAGILSMAVIFLVCWIAIRLRGIRNE